ncbi:MAG TPA: AraC family transcriptional regulator [Fibrobacteraceae bacterium]|nr:AraC family transcriptional regulator [Fibrobacteraceae bacterium]HQB64562.1 AraC family transcriptional regulator [Fibrobacteraceae bacterium]
MSKNIKLSILYVLCIIALVTIWSLFHSKQLEIFPSNSFPKSVIYSYGDESDGGFSTASFTKNDSSLILSLLVRSGIAYPYAGMGIDLISDTQKLSGQFIDFSSFDSLSITLRTKYMKQVQVKLITHDPNLTRLEDPMSARYLLQVIPSDRSYQNIHIPISSFSIPEWWFERNGFKAPDQLKYLERGIKIDISSGSGTMLGIADEIEIKKITLFGSNHFLNKMILSLAIIITALFLGFLWIDHSKRLTEQKIEVKLRKEQALENYSKLPLESHQKQEAERVIDYINSNYQNASLSLEDVCREVGLNRNKLSEILKKNVGMTFSSYVNEIRLKEACRLLIETDLQVIEISINIGFGNVSHFNKVFKQTYQKTPLEYRRAHA